MRPGAKTVLCLAMLAYTCTWMDRSLLLILIEPIKTNLGLSDTEMGLLVGFAFSVVYSVSSLPLSHWIDRGSRRVILSVAIAAWSIATMFSGLANGMLGLVACRLTVAVFESACNPACYSLISGYFSPAMRGRATAIYNLGISLGLWIGLTLGGIIEQRVGWRVTFVIMGIPGLLLSGLTFLLIKDPPRASWKTVHHIDRAGTFWDILRNRPFLTACLSLGMLTIAAGPFEAWAPTYLIRVRAMDPQEAGIVSGVMEGFVGILSVLFSGMACDRMARRGLHWYFLTTAIIFTVFFPASILFFRAHDASSYFYFAAAMFACGCYTAPLFAVGQTLLPQSLSGRGAAVMSLILNILGIGVGDLLIGLISDFLGKNYGNDSLGYAIILLQPFGIAGIALLMLGARYTRRAQYEHEDSSLAKNEMTIG